MYTPVMVRQCTANMTHSLSPCNAAQRPKVQREARGVGHGFKVRTCQKNNYFASAPPWNDLGIRQLTLTHMTAQFALTDYIIFIVYAALILGVGLYVSRSKDGKEKSAEDYFLASKSLPWWAIGASLIAANISAEQFIGCPARASAWDWPSPRTSGWRR